MVDGLAQTLALQLLPPTDASRLRLLPYRDLILSLASPSPVQHIRNLLRFQFGDTRYQR